MRTYRISANFPFALPVTFIAVLSAAWLILNILPIPVEGQFEPKWINPVLATILLIPTGFLSFKMHRCCLTLHENDLGVRTPTWSIPRFWALPETCPIKTCRKSPSAAKATASTRPTAKC